MGWNEGCTYATVVGVEGDGISLLSFLASRYRHSTPAEWIERIGEGQRFLTRLFTEGPQAHVLGAGASSGGNAVQRKPGDGGQVG